MPRCALVALVCLACTSAEPVNFLDGGTWLVPQEGAALAPPEDELHMIVAPLFSADNPTTIILEHPFIDAGDQFVLLKSLSGLGEGPCFGTGGVNCVDILRPRFAGSVITDIDGYAELEIVFDVAPGTEVSLQAWRPGGRGYVSSDSWTAETYTAVDYILGCTHPDAPEYDPEATVDDGSCTAVGIPFGPYNWLLGPRGGTCLGVCETIGMTCADLTISGWVETCDDNICDRFFPGLSCNSDGDGPRLSGTDELGEPGGGSQCVYHDWNWGGWSCAWVERDDDVRFCPCE